MMKLLSVPLKKPTEVDMVKPLSNLIQSAYSTACVEDKAKYCEAVKEFDKQRNVAIWKFFEKFDSSLSVVYTYYDQICALEMKISVNELQIAFKWKDAFDKGSIFGGKITLTQASLSYETVCILFNIAALQSCIAAQQSLDTDEGLKMAIKLLQQSAGIFQHLKRAVPVAISGEPTPDLSQDTLTALQTLMIAQAQEIFIMKAIKDNVKENLIAKLCCQCEELFSVALTLMQKDTIRTLWERDWLPIVAGKQAGFHALTQLYQSLVCRSVKKIGEEIARLRIAVELFKAAQTRSGNLAYFQDHYNKAKNNLEESTKDNELIYNEIVPDGKTLPSLDKAQLAKILSLPIQLSTDFKDIFNELIPVELHRALTTTEVRKTEIVTAEIIKLREATQTLNAILSSLNLPAAIEATDDYTQLPPSLVEKANEVRQKGGIVTMTNRLKELPILLDRNREILDEGERMLNEESNSDKQLRLQFKEKWTRISSENLTEMFRVNARKYREVINNAIKSDRIVNKKFEKNRMGIELLSSSIDKLQEAIPPTGGCVAPHSESVQKLKKLMESVENIKSERDVIESELKQTRFDMKEEFLQALQRDGIIDEPSLSLPQINRILGPLQIQAKESIEKQKQTVSDIQMAHNDFVAETGANHANLSDKLLKDLASAYDNFIELLGNLEEGTKFYNDLTELLLIFQNKISDFCFARKTEKEELLKDLTTEKSRQLPAATPTLPTHYLSTSEGDTSPQANDSKTSASNVPSSEFVSVHSVPYPHTIQGIPTPYGNAGNLPYTPYAAQTPMPQGFNPYATLPYSGAYQISGFPQNHPTYPYGTYPRNHNLQSQKPQGW